MKNFFRRMTAMALAITMTASTLGTLTAFAANGSEWQIKSTGSSYDYHEVIATSATTADTTTPVVTSTNSAKDDDSDANVTITHTIQATNDENVFDMALNVVTTDDLSIIESSPNAAVVLVMDTSMSMDWDIEGNTLSASQVDESRLELAKNSAISFLDSFIANSGDADRMVSLVSFDRYATTQLDWVDGSDKYDSVVSAIEKLDGTKENGTDLGGTNMEAGLLLADSLIDSLGSKFDATNTYVVLLSDGAPTYYDNNGTATSGSISDKNSSYLIGYSVANYTTVSQTESAASDLQKSSILYTIAFAEGDNYAGFRSSGSSFSSLRYAVTVSDWLDSYIASDMDVQTHFDAADGESLTANFQAIAESIARMASAWTVTAPMGQYIQLGQVTDGYSYSTETNGTIVWDLKNDTTVEKTTNKGNTTYTYSLEYIVILNTDAEGFKENTHYLTNGETTLTYCFVDSGALVTESDLKTIRFNVPAVEGKYPEYTYTVNHYLQDGVNEDGTFTYELDQSKDYDGIDKYDVVSNHRTKVYENYTYGAFDSDGGYAEEIQAFENSEFNGGITITKNGQNLNFYYHRDTTTATVNHYYYTINTSNSGATVTEETPAQKIENLVYIGDEYEAATANKTGYVQITEAPDADGDYTISRASTETITLVADGGENVVNYYYASIVDTRTDVEIDVSHEYVTYKWEIGKDGRYEEVIASTETMANGTVTQKYGTTFTAVQVDRDGFTYEGISKSSGNFDGLYIAQLNKDSSITLTYELHTENPNDYIDATVEHIYYTTTISIDANGNEQTVTTETGREGHTFTDDYRLGEVFAPEKEETFDGNDYKMTSVSPSASIVLSADKNEITFTYSRTVDNRTETEVTVYHDYTLYEGKIDEEGKYYVELNEMENMDWADTYTVDVDGSTLYVGQSYSAISDTKGYEQITDDEALTITLEEGANEITIQYQLTEDLDDADVTVKHYYKTYTTTYVNGELSVNKGFYTLGETVSYEGHEGESYTADEITSYDGNDDYTRVGDNSLTVTLGNGDKTIKVFYLREVEDFTDTAVTVNHHFTTITSIVDGEGQVDTTSDTETVTFADIYSSDEIEQLFAGMAYTAVEDATMDGREDFTAKSNNKTTIILIENPEENIIDLYYTKQVDAKESATVQVIHQYTTYTTTLQGNVAVEDDGVTTETYETLVVGKYAGQYFTATPAPNGFDQTTEEADYADVILEAGKNVIYIAYEIHNDVTLPSTLEVTHIYTTEYAVGDTLTETTVDEIVNSWATVAHIFNVDTNEDLFEVTDIDSDNESVNEKEYTVTLEEGTNKITVEYYRYVDNRTATSVTVNHYYFVYDAYTDVTTEEGNTTATYVAYLEDGTFTADLEKEFGDNVYSHQDGERTIDITEESNIIDLYYLHTIDTTPEDDGNDKPSKPNIGTLVTPDDDDDTTPEIEIPETDVPLTDTPTTTEPEETVETPEETVETPEEVIEVPEEIIEIPEEEVPLIEIPEVEVPLSDVPYTGDNRNLPFMVTTALVSAAGLLILLKKELDEKKKDAAK